jgi:hypothetical protein
MIEGLKTRICERSMPEEPPVDSEKALLNQGEK